MQILGKKSKLLLVGVAIAMLTALGISFAAWDNMSTVKAATGSAAAYASAHVGDVIQYGRYYQTGIKDEATGEYEKTPIEWIVVDKDERAGQLTLMSKYILACGGYFGNWYNNKNGAWGANYDGNDAVAGIPYNQAYVDSTIRAYLNNLERLDVGGDSFDAEKGYIPSAVYSTADNSVAGSLNKGSGLLSSVGFSNQRYWTNLNTVNAPGLEGKPGFHKRVDNTLDYYEYYYKRPIESDEYKNRPATRGFYDEAFTDDEKAMIVPKVIAGYTGHRWPDNEFNVASKSYVEGCMDKVWLPSTTELNVANGVEREGGYNVPWSNPSDSASSTVFAYFRDYGTYGFASVTEAIIAERTPFARDSYAMNYSIPVYKLRTSEANTDINETKNSSDHYWTRTPTSYWHHYVRIVNSSGLFYEWSTNGSDAGARPCIILKY